jgi:hypothetical protein
MLRSRKYREGRHIETDTNAWTAVAKAAGLKK